MEWLVSTSWRIAVALKTETESMEKELAKLMVKLWTNYCDGPIEDIEPLIEGSPLFEQRFTTEEDIEEGNAPDGHEVDDPYWVLSDLGKQAWELAHAQALPTK